MTTRNTLNNKLRDAHHRLQSSADDPEVALVRRQLRALAEELSSTEEVPDDLRRRIDDAVAEAKAIYVFDEGDSSSSSAQSSRLEESKFERVVEQPAQQAAPVAVQSSSDADPTLNDVMRGIEELNGRQLSDEHRKVLEVVSADELEEALMGGLEYSRRNDDSNRAVNKPAEDRDSDNDRDSFVDMFRQWFDDRRLSASKH